jgi:hypothetical protein
MSSSSKKRTTMAKMTRERAVRERRARKQEKKDEKKAARLAEADGTALPADTAADTVDEEATSAEPLAPSPPDLQR